MSGHTLWEDLKRRANDGGGIDKSLVDLFNQGYRQGETGTLEAMHHVLLNMAEGAEQSGTTGDLTYASGLRDAATLMARTLERRRKEWPDADAE